MVIVLGIAEIEDGQPRALAALKAIQEFKEVAYPVIEDGKRKYKRIPVILVERTE